jgi:hypothetical protein
MATSTSTPKGRGYLIDLTPDEAGVLSFVAAYAKIPSAKPQLNNVLSTSTKRAQAIGAMILGQSKTTSPGTTFMAKRFSSASASNTKNSDILNKASGLK